MILGEGVGFVVHLFGGGGLGEQKDAIAEDRGLIFLQGEVQGWLFGVEDGLAQRICGEETVAAGVPVGRVAGVAGVVDDGDGFSVIVCVVPVR